MQVVFILAKSSDSIIHHYVDEESTEFQDIWFGNFMDTYQNLTRKTLLMLNVFTEFYPNAKYLLKIDDNVGLNLRVLLDVLNDIPETEFILGHVLNESAPMRGECYKKWYLPEDIYHKPTFPPYTTGPAYILTHNAAKQILSVCSDINEKLHLEDVFFTGICREKANVAIKDDARFCQRYVSSEQVCATKHRRLTTFEEKLKALRQLAKLQVL